MRSMASRRTRAGARSARPSFETAATQPPQDEVGVQLLAPQDAGAAEAIMNIAAWLHRAGLSHPGLPAVGKGPRATQSYGELAERAERLGGAGHRGVVRPCGAVQRRA